MNMTKLDSGNLHSAGWSRGVLRIAFADKNGGVRAVWDYEPCPEHTFEQLCNAESAGRYFNSHIKGVIRGTEVSGIDAPLTGVQEHHA